MAEGVVLVGQIREVLDSGSQSSLVINVELLSAEWVFQFSIENDGKGNRIKEEETELGMTVASGREVAESVSASAGFSGWGFSAEVSGSTETRTFSSIETSNIKRVKDTYTCPPESAIFVYKRRYKFRCRSWFFSEANDEWYETKNGKIEAQFVNEITANQELISPVALNAHGKIVNNPPAGLVIPTKGWNIESNDNPIWLVLFVILKSTYPWIK